MVTREVGVDIKIRLPGWVDGYNDNKLKFVLQLAMKNSGNGYNARKK